MTYITNNNEILKATLHINSGDSSLLCGDYSPSITSYQLALDTLKNVSSEDSPADSTNTITFLQFRIHSHSAMAHLSEEDYFSVMKSVTSAKSYSENIPPIELGALYAVMGEASYQLQQYAESLKAFTKSFSCYEAVYETELSSSLLFQKKKKNVLDWMEKVKGKITQMTPQKTSSEPALSSSVTDAARKRKAQALCPKYQYYQNDSFVTIAILEPNLTHELLTVDYEGNDHLTVKVIKGMPDPVECTVICGTLFDAVNVGKCKIVLKGDKVLVKLFKAKKMNWHELFGKGEKKEEKKNNKEGEEKSSDVTKDKQEDVSTLTSEPPPTLEGKKNINRPYSSTKDWNKIEQNLKKDEEDEKPEGDEALQKLFRDIYGKANSDTRRAMNKSFQTSGGTVLSTNWKEVKGKDYEKERTAPKGMEWKNWEGKKLPMKKDP